MLVAGSSNPSPAIVKKVKKVVEVRLDAPELTVALQQLNDFYGLQPHGHRVPLAANPS
jgi:hypothetical protein